MRIYYEKKLSFSSLMVATEIQSFNSYSIKHLDIDNNPDRGRCVTNEAQRHLRTIP